MKRVLLALALAGYGWAYSSLAVAGNTGRLSVPHVAPFNALGDYRVEFRIHAWTAPTTGYTQIFSWGSSYINQVYLEIVLTHAGELCAVDRVDSFSRNNFACTNLTGHTDVIVRVQRFGASYPSELGSVGSFLLEAWDVSGASIARYCQIGTPGNSYACPITTAVTRDWTQTAGYIGNPSTPTYLSLAWLKWLSTTVPPGGLAPIESTPADLADFRFENNLTNQGTGGYAVTIGSFNSGPSYSASGSYAPGCACGNQQTFRAGFRAQLDGTNSYPLNGASPLTYLWQQLSGPTSVRWFGQDTARPVVTGTVFGSYVFQLTVTDSSGQSSFCRVKHGFTATDRNHLVITWNSAMDMLLGPMIQYGTNPWPWFDDRHRADADLQAANLDTYFRPYWETDTLGAGTVTVTAGSTTVTGVGTSFTTSLCQGPGDPTTPQQLGGLNMRLIVWYPNASEEGYGLREMKVNSCQSDTMATIDAWGTDVADCHGGGCRYSMRSPLYSNWTSNSAPANFYDAVAAFYSLYYRSGIDDYQTAARKLADRFWKYRLDSGMTILPSPRNVSLLGMILRALDGRPDMWPGLDHQFNSAVGSLTTSDTFLDASRRTDGSHWGLWDIREMAYHLAMVSYCAMLDPSSTMRESCKSALSYNMSHMWNWSQAYDGSWQQLYSPEDSKQHSWSTPPTTVSLVHGSTAVVGTGTAWSSSMFSTMRYMVFLPTTDRPTNFQGQEPTYYTIMSSQFIDETHLTLDRPYEGTTGTHGWMLDYVGAVGWGTQPFIEGILGLAFDFTAKALAETDPTTAALARSYTVSIANWERDYGYHSAVKGMYYFSGPVNCLAPIPESSTWCTANNTAAQARVLNAESLRAVMLAYSYSGDASLKAFADTLYNAMFGKAGYCPSGSDVCVPDGQYLGDLNDGVGWYMTGTPTGHGWHKYFGMFFGIGAGSDWPAYRAGGPRVSRCDVNADGAVDVVDVLRCINAALGVTACGAEDVDGDGRCTVSDVLQVINAAIGKGCAADE
jgi:hypothetical protein